MDRHRNIVFSSWGGRYADNPRAIAEELARRGMTTEQTWLLDEAAGPVPAHVRGVAPQGPEAISVLEAASHIISNDVLAHAFSKRPDATYVQTWHGTPLKRIAFDVERWLFPDAKPYEVWLPRDVARWDLLLSPNRYSTEVLRSAFRFDGEVVETGYPRNDLLSSAEAGGIRAGTRERLGLSDGITAVLYAPTWRDPDPFHLELDLQELRRELGDDVVVLLRAHWLVATTVDAPSMTNCIDVSSYQDLRELYLAADVLLTDYSSVMFDFAITGKPMLFLVYDLARYRDQLRGFYFDFEASAPGPLLSTTTDLVEALRDLERGGERYAEAYAAFRERFCHRDDGRASERVVDMLFGGGESSASAAAPVLALD